MVEYVFKVFHFWNMNLLTYPLLSCLSHSTTSSVSTVGATAPKLPSEITGKTVEEVFHVITSWSCFQILSFMPCNFMSEWCSQGKCHCLQEYLNIGNIDLLCGALVPYPIYARLVWFNGLSHKYFWMRRVFNLGFYCRNGKKKKKGKINLEFM